MNEANNLPSAATAYYFPEPLNIDASVNAFYGELLRGMTHKLNNSLAVIQGFASLMMMNGGSGASFKDNIDHVKQAADIAKILNERILSAGGCVRVSPQSLNLGDYIPMVDRELRKPCEGAEIAFQLNLAAGVPAVMVDSSRFKEILLELLKNAAEAVTASGDGEVALDILPPGQVSESIPGHVDVFVRNSGSSIAADKFDEAFKPFSSTKATTHFGIGLTTVRALCSQMNITVGAKSDDNTTTFWLSVPVA
ncbi:MAG: signal transduction histidine kinase [Verrucomicrobiales bacterium]|jgi:signal transduction histidine kinase